MTYAELLHGVEMADGRRRQRRQQFAGAVAGEGSIIAYDLSVVTPDPTGSDYLPGVTIRRGA